MAQCLYKSGMNRDSDWDKDSERRQLYGSAYSFRPKSFGMEYRYLSNAWVDNEKAMEFVFNVAKNTVNNLDAEYTKTTKHIAEGLTTLAGKRIYTHTYFDLTSTN